MRRPERPPRLVDLGYRRQLHRGLYGLAQDTRFGGGERQKGGVAEALSVPYPTRVEATIAEVAEMAECARSACSATLAEVGRTLVITAAGIASAPGDGLSPTALSTTTRSSCMSKPAMRTVWKAGSRTLRLNFVSRIVPGVAPIHPDDPLS